MHIVPNAQSARATIHDALAAYDTSAQSAVFLVPSQAAVTQCRKLWADESFSFGLKITTLNAWLADRWELYGAGNRIVSSLQRKLLLHKVLSSLIAEKSLQHLVLTPGTVSLLANMAAEALPYLLDNFASEAFKLFTKVEIEVCTVLKEYAQLLDYEGLCEQSQAMLILAKGDWPLPHLFVELADRQSFLEKSFFEELGKATEVNLYFDEMSLPAQAQARAQELVDVQLRLFKPDPANPVKAKGALRFLLPAGHYAEPLLIAKSIAQYAREGNQSIAIAARHPLALFERIAPYLYERSIGLRVVDRRSFATSDFGKLWLLLLHFLNARVFSTFQLSDIALNPFSDISKHKAYELDASWRGDRSCTKQECLADLASASKLFGKVLDSLEKGQPEEALDSFEAVARTKFMWSEAYRAQQLSALNHARTHLGFMKDFDLEPIEALRYLEDISLSCATEAFDDSSGKHLLVDLMSLEGLAEQEPCSYDTLIITDLDTASYSIRDESRPADQLLEKLGLLEKEDSLEKARRQFFRALSVPLKQLVCERVLNTVNAQPAYPAVMLEELLDCYRRDLLSNDELDKNTGLPEKLKPYAETAGEDNLYQNLAVVDTQQIIRAYESPPPHGKLTKAARSKIVLANTRAASPALSLSPSAIESYLECPYKWFTLRRLRLETPDAGFGSLEMGSFAHRLLKAFYGTFQKFGSAKVTKNNLADAKALLSELFDQHIGFQREFKRKENPLIALSALEEAELASFKKKLLRYLDREAILLPQFTPRYFEYDFGKEGTLAYAGGLLHGTVDRIDVNDKGQAVVIDYKGAVASDYAYHSASEIPWASSLGAEKVLVLPHKVQALLYAQAVRRELGLDVLAAIYVSYGRDAKISGGFDHRVLDAKDLPGIDVRACAVGEVWDGAENVSEEDMSSEHSAAEIALGSGGSAFSSVLDRVEASIACALNKLQEGYIEAHPRGKDPCRYCPVTACLARRVAK